MKLRAGDWIEVRSKSEILATLDDRGRLEDLPFMPEMFQFCGRRFRVWKRAHKTCDTVNRTGGRRLTNAVHLEELRCDGQGHGGCQAGCLIFWKDAWLKTVTNTQLGENSVAASNDPEPQKANPREQSVYAGTLAEGQKGSTDPTYVCQATSLPEFTTLLPWWDVRQYIEDYTSGNNSLWRIFRGFLYMGYHKLINAGIGLGRSLRWLYDKFQAIHGGIPYPRRYGTIPVGQATPDEALNLQPGEQARVKCLKEILSTLNRANKNKGMYFDAEEVPYCGKVFRVLARVERIIDERTGKMIRLKSSSVILQGAHCQSRYSEKRLFCPRAIYAFWRDPWLERVGDTEPVNQRRTATNEAKVEKSEE